MLLQLYNVDYKYIDFVIGPSTNILKSLYGKYGANCLLLTVFLLYVTVAGLRMVVSHSYTVNEGARTKRSNQSLRITFQLQLLQQAVNKLIQSLNKKTIVIDIYIIMIQFKIISYE